jgi:hypothetical protein
MACVHQGSRVSGNCPACLLALGIVDFEPGTVVGGRFRIVAPLGRGGIGEVYRADDLKLGHEVALKFVPASEEMLREVRVGRQIAHPNVCRLYDVVDVDEGPAIVMEYVDGEDLALLLDRGPLSRPRALQIARDVCAGLDAIHEKGVAHGDLKPANVMIDSRGRARITDFGLSARGGDAGRFGGTPAYMAPEQREERRATASADLYALGLLLSELLPGEMPAKRATSAHELIAAIEEGELAVASDRAFRLTAWQAWLAVAAIVGLWLLPSTRAALQPRPLQGTIYIVLLTAALVAGVVLAWRNLRAGPVDRRGAARVALWVFACRALAGILAASRPPTLEAAAAFASTLLATSLFLAAEVWLAYAALEPHVRREWPDALVGWTRLVRGRFRDALVGRDVLLGVLAGVVMRLFAAAPATPNIFHSLARAVFYALFALFLLVLLRMAARRPWIAAALWLAVTTATWSRWDAPPMESAAVAAQMLVLLIVLQRLGLLAAAVAIFTFLQSPATSAFITH